MNTLKKLRIVLPVTGGLLGVMLLSSLALAVDMKGSVKIQGSRGATAEVKVSANSANIKAKADQEIARRIAALNALSARVQLMVRVSASEKAEIASEVASQISSLTALKAKVDADTDSAVLRADVISIVNAYRIYILVIPKGRILVAADKIATVAARFTELGEKLQVRITAAGSAGKNIIALQREMDDFNAKVADSALQAQNAAVAVASLTPDNGDKIKLEANLAALRLARADLTVAWKDLTTALIDARAIIHGLRGLHISPSVTPTASM